MYVSRTVSPCNPAELEKKKEKKKKKKKKKEILSDIHIVVKVVGIQ